MSGNLESGNRILSVRFWYPAKTTSKAASENYRHEMKPFGQEPLIINYQGRAIADAAPLSGQKFPIIIMSHGFGGWNTQFSDLGEHLATHGYVVASIDHADQRVEGVPSFLLSFGNVLTSRMLDQRQILNKILGQAALETGPFIQIDPEQVGLIGYSMGGYGALAASGAPYQFDADPMANIPEAAKTAMQNVTKRPSPIDALVAISP